MPRRGIDFRGVSPSSHDQAEIQRLAHISGGTIKNQQILMLRNQNRQKKGQEQMRLHPPDTAVVEEREIAQEVEKRGINDRRKIKNKLLGNQEKQLQGIEGEAEETEEQRVGD